MRFESNPDTAMRAPRSTRGNQDHAICPVVMYFNIPASGIAGSRGRAGWEATSAPGLRWLPTISISSSSSSPSSSSSSSSSSSNCRCKPVTTFSTPASRSSSVKFPPQFRRRACWFASTGAHSQSFARSDSLSRSSAGAAAALGFGVGFS